jgi:hypothetical protein
LQRNNQSISRRFTRINADKINEGKLRTLVSNLWFQIRVYPRKSAANKSLLTLDSNQVARIVDREDADKPIIAEIKSSQAAV